MLEQRGPSGSPACPSDAGRRVVSTYLATLPLSTLLSSSGMEPEVVTLHRPALRRLIFFSQFTQSHTHTFWVMVSVWRSCLGRTLLAIPSAVFSSPGFHIPPTLLPLCLRPFHDSADGLSQFLALLIWGQSIEPTTSSSLHRSPCLSPVRPAGPPRRS